LQAVAAIAALEQRGWRLGLDRMQEFCRRAGLTDALGAPGGPQFIHVAGTNGKGSTTAFLQSILTSAGYPTGSFFSPYVVDYRERIQFGRELISEDDLAEVATELFPIAESMTGTEFEGVSKFEFEAGMGFLYWKKKRCKWVALEVGLGGRLDATNVATTRSSIIVSIGLDHVSVLGDTIEKIAFEKAGIVKPGVPVVVGSMRSPARSVIEMRAEELGSPVWLFGRDVTLEHSNGVFSVSTPSRTVCGLTSGLEGEMQPHNAALAIASIEATGLDLDDNVIRTGVHDAYAPGRFHHARYGDSELLLDGAHNRDAGIVLRASLDRAFPGRPLHLVTNMLSGHDPSEFYGQLGERVETADVVPVDFSRALPVEEAAKALDALMPVVRAHASVEEGLNAACRSAGTSGLVLVTGSNYVVGSVLRVPGVATCK
jgi:dihydrofolate synthase/folylpolyglutamate synthase